MNNALPLGPDGWLADQVRHMALREGFACIGLLTTERVYAAGLLRRQLLSCGLRCVVPCLYERRELIYACEVINEDPEAATYHLLAVATSLHERQGAQRILVASPAYERSLAGSAIDDILILGTTQLAAEMLSHWGSVPPLAYW
jgi:hypothetical protein